MPYCIRRDNGEFDSLRIGHIHPTIVHHVPEKHDGIWALAAYGAPALPEVEVHNELAQTREPCWAIGIRPAVKDLRVCYYENVCR